MNETVWVAIIAVLGTSLGAAISPAITAWRDVATSRNDANADRVKSAAEFAEKLFTLGQRNPDRYDSIAVRSALNEAVAARFTLARHLGRGEGNVDRFAADAISLVQRYTDERREFIAHVAGNRILTWARRDVSARDLKELDAEALDHDLPFV